MLPELTEGYYLSRFFVKFVEILAAGLATAMCGYLIAYLGSPLPPAAPVPVVVSAAPSAGEAAGRVPVQPAPAVADLQQRAPQPVVADAPPAQPARRAEKAATAAPAPKDVKDVKSGTARSEKSVEALARAALANLDAERPAPADAPVQRASTGAASAPLAQVDIPPRQADLQPAVEALPRRVAAVEPLPNAGAPPEIAAPEPEPQADEHTGPFSFLKQMPHLLRLGTSSLAGQAPRPPMPVGATSDE
jgi:hypothetical protein